MIKMRESKNYTDAFGTEHKSVHLAQGSNECFAYREIYFNLSNLHLFFDYPSTAALCN